MIDDALRPPLPTDPTAEAYKDWLHLNVFDHASGAIGLFSASLHGAPGDARARAIGAALVHLPALGWVGNVEVGALDDAAVGEHSIAMERLAVAVDAPSDRVLVSAQYPDDGLVASLAVRGRARALDIEARLPFGPGWISWFVEPRLSLDGSLALRDRKLDLAGGVGYHDHNWGRWHWGDDVGWEWGALVAAEPGPTIVVTRTTDRAHRHSGEPMLMVEDAGRRTRFRAGAVEFRLEGRYEGPPLRRLPGALAALHQDRARPRLPGRVHVVADDGLERVDLEFLPRAAAQLIAGDPVRRGYGFVHELVGEFTARLRLARGDRSVRGLGVFEYVD